MTITPETQVSEIVTHHPGATKVFHRHGIDFCCGGKRPLGEACEERRLDPDQILGEIAAVADGNSEERDWSTDHLTDLVMHILSRYHAPLREELPRLQEMADKVANVHGKNHPEALPLAERFRELKEELASHMLKEEQVLFPYVARLETAAAAGRPVGPSPFGTVAGPISVMEAEHEHAGRLLAEMRRLTSDYQLPTDACNTFRALYHGLEELERDLHLHIHLENNVLFPRAAAMEQQAAAPGMGPQVRTPASAMAGMRSF